MHFLLRSALWLPFIPLAAWAQTDSSHTVRPPALEDIRYDTINRSRYRIRGTAIGALTLKDQFLSPLKYSGMYLSMDRTAYRQLPGKLRKTRLITHSTGLSNGLNDNSLLQTGFEYNYAWFFPVGRVNAGKTSFYAGAMATGLFNLKIHLGNVNNVLSYDVAVSLGPVGMAQRRFRLFRRTFMLTEELSLPVVSVMARPPYAWPLPYFSEEGGRFTDALQVGSWNRFMRIQNQVSLDFYLKQKKRRKLVGLNAYRLTYQWNYQQMNRPNKLQTGMHSLFLGRIIKF